MLSKSAKFLDFQLLQGTVAGVVEIFVVSHREFSYESAGERLLKIGPHLPKCQTSSVLHFRDTVYYYLKLLEMYCTAVTPEGHALVTINRVTSRTWVIS